MDEPPVMFHGLFERHRGSLVDAHDLGIAERHQRLLFRRITNGLLVLAPFLDLQLDLLPEALLRSLLTFQIRCIHLYSGRSHILGLGGGTGLRVGLGDTFL